MGSYHKIDCSVVVRDVRPIEEVVGSTTVLYVGPGRPGGWTPYVRWGRSVEPDCQVGRVGGTCVSGGTRHQWGLNVNQLDTKSEYMICVSHICSHI
jgi:hypothetical protein